MRTLESWLEYISVQHWQSMDLGLERMRVMVERMALARPAPTVITVAGTNGKGSTCVACEAMLLAQGLKVGATLSPHVHKFNERMRLNGREMEDADICSAFEAVEAARGDLTLTYFEFSALAALFAFIRAGVDVAILEIGLGGRLDAFNVIDADVAVITSIGLDHEQFLGNTLEAIGAEKAGILRRGQSVLLGPEMPRSVLERCSALALQPVMLGADYDFAVNPDGSTWAMHQGPDTLLADIPMGACAPQNLLLAYLAARAVLDVPPTCVSETAVTFRMPGRMQRFDFRHRGWVLDVAHNPAGAEFLCRQLEMRGLEPALIVCGMLRDKPHAEVYATVARHFDGPWLLVGTHGERGLDAQALAAALPDSARACESWESVFDEVDSATADGDAILVFGSFNVIEQFEKEHCD